MSENGEFPTIWKSVKVKKATYEKIIEMKSRAEKVAKDNVTIGEIMDQAIELALEHWDAGLVSWGVKRKAAT